MVHHILDRFSIRIICDHNLHSQQLWAVVAIIYNCENQDFAIGDLWTGEIRHPPCSSEQHKLHDWQVIFDDYDDDDDDDDDDGEKNDDNDDGYEFDIPQALPNNSKSVD